MGKLLTISIAAYNVEKYLEKVLYSCVVPEKYYPFLEIIIVNDGSSDNTLEIAKRYEKCYPDIFKCINKGNGGYGSTINCALKYATGKYFRLLDGDDWFNNDELICFLEIIKELDVDLILNDFFIFSERKQIEKKIEVFNETFMNCPIKELPIKENWAMYSFCFKTDILKQNKIFITENCFYTDIEFMLLPLVYCRTFSYVKNTLYSYRIGYEGQSVSYTGMRKHYKDTYIVVNKMLRTLDNCDIEENVKTNMENIITILSKMMIKSHMCITKKGTKRKLIELEIFLRESNGNIHKKVYQNKFLRIIRLTNYHFYFIYPFLKKRNFVK